MDNLHSVLKNNYPYWIIKESEKKPESPITNSDTGLEVKKNVYISVPYVPGLVKILKNTYQCTSLLQRSQHP